MNTDEKCIKIIINEIDDLFTALERLQCIEKEDFFNDSHIKKIATQTLINISETIDYISSEYKISNSEIDWKQFKTIRNIAAHKYGAINFFIVWQIVKVNLPDFRTKLILLTQNNVKSGAEQVL